MAVVESCFFYTCIELKGKLPRYLWRAEMDLADLVKVKEVKTKFVFFLILFLLPF